MAISCEITSDFDYSYGGGYHLAGGGGPLRLGQQADLSPPAKSLPLACVDIS